MIEIRCSREEYENIIDMLAATSCPKRPPKPCRHSIDQCPDCWRGYIKRIDTFDIKPDPPTYNTSAENTAYLQGFNVALKMMKGGL